MPYTPEVLYALHARLLGELWPLAAPLALLTLAALLAVIRGAGGFGRPVAAVLAAGWLWAGVVFHFQYFATINFAAPVYGGLFVVQGLLLAWQGAWRDRLNLGFGGRAPQWAGLVLALYALAVYPLVDYLAAGDGLRLAGLAPGPTAALTLGLLLQARGPIPLHLLAVPVAWCVVAGLTGLELGVPADVSLLAVAAVAMVAALRHNRGAGPGGAG